MLGHSYRLHHEEVMNDRLKHGYNNSNNGKKINDVNQKYNCVYIKATIMKKDHSENT